MYTGGTVDVAAHEVLQDGKIREIYPSSGGNWGGTKVDEKFTSFIKEVVGIDAMQEFEENYKDGVVELQKSFENLKRSINQDMGDFATITIPVSLLESFNTTNPGKTLKNLKEVRLENGRTANVLFTSNKLKFDSKTANRFFKHVLSKIMDHISTLLKRERGRDIASIIMVGGFADSQALLHKVRLKFPNKRLIVPQDAAWAVLKGAVIFGHNPNLIKQRRSRYTYGVGVSRKFVEGLHDEEHKFTEDGMVRCNDIFDKHVERDQLITVGEYQTDKSYGLLSSFGFQWGVYASSSADPKYVTDKDCFKVGDLILPNQQVDISSKVRLQMSFSLTEIEVKLTYLKTKATTTLYLQFHSNHNAKN